MGGVSTEGRGNPPVLGFGTTLTRGMSPRKAFVWNINSLHGKNKARQKRSSYVRERHPPIAFPRRTADDPHEPWIALTPGHPRRRIPQEPGPIGLGGARWTSGSCSNSRLSLARSISRAPPRPATSRSRRCRGASVSSSSSLKFPSSSGASATAGSLRKASACSNGRRSSSKTGRRCRRSWGTSRITTAA